MKKIIVLLLAFWGISQARAQLQTWTNDPEHTRIGFEIGHAGLSLVSGRFTDFDIHVVADEKHIEQTKLSVKVSTASINTGVAPRDKHLRSADFFNVEKYPYMLFEGVRAKKVNSHRGKLYGNLTIHGVTRPVVLDVELIGKRISPVSHKYTAGFRLRGTLKRSDFNLGPKYLPDMIANEVKILVDAEFASGSAQK